MTTLLPNYRDRTARDILDRIRGTLPPMTSPDWAPETGVEAVDRLRASHRTAAQGLTGAIDALPARLAAVDVQIADHARALQAYSRQCGLAMARGELVPPKVATPNFAAALDAAWAPLAEALAHVAHAVRAIAAEVGRNGYEIKRRHVTPGQLRGEWYFGPSSAGGNASPRDLYEGTRDGSLQLEISCFDGLVAEWRSALDPPITLEVPLAA
jgi:hypothetical protein